jgi:hypothetical protein
VAHLLETIASCRCCFQSLLPWLVCHVMYGDLSLQGWVSAGALLGGFSPAAQGGNSKAAAGAAVKTWAVGVPVGVVLRSISRGYIPSTSFMVVSMVATGVLMVGWRTALAALTPQVSSVTMTRRLLLELQWCLIHLWADRQHCLDRLQN